MSYRPARVSSKIELHREILLQKWGVGTLGSPLLMMSPVYTELQERTGELVSHFPKPPKPIRLRIPTHGVQ